MSEVSLHRTADMKSAKDETAVSEQDSRDVDTEKQDVLPENTAAEEPDTEEQDVEMPQAPTPNPAQESIAQRNHAETEEDYGVDEDDLDGGILDGALDDYDDLDQDTEDTEVGDGPDDFSDDDDLDDDLDDRILDSSDKPGPEDEMMHVPAEMALTDEKAEDQEGDADVEDADDVASDAREMNSAPVQSDDSDSGDLPEPEATEDESEQEDEGEGGEADAEEEEEEEEEDAEDEPEVKAPEIKKDIVYPQKAVLNRPLPTEEELKDSGDELSDLSEFDDTDDSDEDDHMAPASINRKEPAPTTSSSAAASTSTNAKAVPGGRKRSLLHATTESATKDDTAAKEDQDDQAKVPNGRSRHTESPSRNRKVSSAGDTQRLENEPESEVGGEDDDNKAAVDDDEEEEEEEDVETKQMHKEALDALTSIEVEFANLRDKMYEERMAELDNEVAMINNGTHPELSSLVQEIKQKHEQRLKVAQAGRKYKNDIAQCQLESTVYQAHCTFQSSRRNTRAEIARDLGRKQRQLLSELTQLDTQKRKAAAEKAALVRTRKMRKTEALELKSISERRGFPASAQPAMISSADLDEDFIAMGLARPQPPTLAVDHGTHHYPRSTGTGGGGQLARSHVTGSSVAISSSARPISSNKWSTANDYLPSSMSHPPPSGSGYYGSRPEVEIYVDGSQCNVDGIWYKPNDSVVVLDAAIGKYNAKYLFLANEEIMLQRTDGSKTRLHLSLFRGRKLYMQPKP